MKLICEGFAEDTFAARAGAGGISALQTEIFHQPVEFDAVVVPVFSKLDEVLARLGYQIAVDNYAEIAKISGH
jgi:hypothetical protein